MKQLKNRLNMITLFRNSIAIAAIASLASLSGGAADSVGTSIESTPEPHAAIDESLHTADAEESVCMLVPRRTRLIINFQRTILV